MSPMAFGIRIINLQEPIRAMCWCRNWQLCCRSTCITHCGKEHASGWSLAPIVMLMQCHSAWSACFWLRQCLNKLKQRWKSECLTLSQASVPVIPVCCDQVIGHACLHWTARVIRGFRKSLSMSCYEMHINQSLDQITWMDNVKFIPIPV